MTIADRWLLPDGIDEVLPYDAQQIEWVRAQVLSNFNTWGYDYVMPPVAEYLESLLTGTSHDLDLLTYKITDQMTGRQMGLPADITQQVARMDAHSMPCEYSARYCYASQVLRTKPSSLLSNRCPLQIGAELFGSAEVEADVEVVSLMLSSLAAINLTDVTLDLGNVEIFKALSVHWELTDSQQSELRSILQRKSTPELQTWLIEVNFDSQKIEQANQYFSLSGGINTIATAEKALAGLSEQIDNAIKSLKTVVEAVIRDFPSVNIHIDLAELRGYNYHTGLVFAVFAQGNGKALAKGGRYDETGSVFGRARPATGFSMDARFIAQISKTGTTACSKIFAPKSSDDCLRAHIKTLRLENKVIVQALNDNDTAETLGCCEQLIKESGSWTVVKV